MDENTPRLNLARLIADRATIIALIAGAVALAASPHLGGLECLDLRDNPGIGGAPAAALRARYEDRVRLDPAEG